MPFDARIVAIPAGRSGASSRVSALFTPDLAGSGPLRNFSTWADWPKSLARTTFKVAVDGANEEIAATVVSAADSQTWLHLFDDDLPVPKPPTPRAVTANDTPLFQSFAGVEMADLMASRYDLAAQEAHQMLVGAAAGQYDRNKRVALLPMREPLGKLAEFHRDARHWNPWLSDNASEQDRAASDALARCLRNNAAMTAIQEDLARVARRFDDVDKTPAPEQLLRRLSPLLVRGLLEKHERWGAIRECLGELMVTSVQAFRPEVRADAKNALEAAMFHRVSAPSAPDHARGRERGDTNTSVGDAPQRMDFYAYLSALTQHPPLLATLGIVVTLELSAALGKTGRIRIKATRRPPVEDGTPPDEKWSTWTQFESTDTTFIPAGDPQSAGRKIGRGFLDLASGYELRCIDSHEAYSKVKAVGSPVGTGQEVEPVIAGGQDNPKLHTAGLILYEKDPVTRAHAEAVRRSDRRAAGENVTLYAEDLLAGFRIDVRQRTEGTGPWRSLCLRETRYDFVDMNGRVRFRQTPDANDRATEGAILPSVSHPADGGDGQLQQEVCRWENWSLAAPLPTRQAPDPDQYDHQVVRPPRVRAHHTAATGSLPRLLFANSYDMRCRAMFLDGSGMPPEQPSGEGSWKSAMFERQEWVASPNVVLATLLQSERNCGEGLTTLAIRTRDGSPSRQVAERYIVPPRVDASLPLYHGYWIDDLSGAFKDRALHPDGTFITAYELQHLTPVGPDDIPVMDRNPIWAGRRNYEPLCVRYYPDPLAYSLAAWLDWWRVDADGAPVCDEASFSLYENPGRWPNSRALKVSLIGAPRDQAADGLLKLLKPDESFLGVRAGDDYVMVVSLRVGFTARLLVGTTPFVASQDERRMSVGEPSTVQSAPISRSALRWMSRLSVTEPFDRMADDERARAIARVFAANPFGNAPREMRLVHASEKPLERPRFLDFGLTLKEDEATVGLDFEIARHLPTTARLDVHARWIDDVDDTETPNIPLAPGTGRDGPGLRPAAGSSVLTPPLDVPPPTGKWSAVETERYARQLLLHDTKYREVTYSIRAASRYAEFFEPTSAKPPADTRRFTIDGANEWRVKILNRAVPRGLQVRYPTPAFDWNRTRHGDVHRSYRQGGIVRLRLDRPWNCSGNGEMCGVIVANGPDATAVSPILDRVSRWGQDPIRESLGVSPLLTLGSFQGWAAHLNNVPLLRELDPSAQGEQAALNRFEDQPVTVVGYLPKFPDRTGCYVDVELDPGSSYCPFVSLAVARFQQHSLDGKHLSQASRIDMVQVLPHRWVDVWVERKEVVVRMYGYTHGQTPVMHGNIGTRMRVAIQQRTSGGDAELCWVPAIGRDGAELGDVAPARPWSSLRDRPLLTPGFRPSDFFSYWEVRLPLPDRKFAMHYRVFVEELEDYLTEIRSDPRGERPKPWENMPRAVMSRVAFSEIVDL